MKSKPRMLFLDDCTKRIEAARLIYGEGFSLTCVYNVKECLRYMSREDWDIVSLDFDLDGNDYTDPNNVNSGMAIVRYIELFGWPDNRKKPEFSIHSSNSFAVSMMVKRLDALGFRAAHIPLVYPEKRWKKGLVAGVFDLLHPGYIAMFDEAKTVCEYLIVALHADPNFERPEKPKPIFAMNERVSILKSLRQVDEVVCYFREDDLVILLDELSPDVRILGSDYMDHSKLITGDNIVPHTYYVDRRNHPWSASRVRQLIKEAA